jgi:hypothetical protein
VPGATVLLLAVLGLEPGQPPGPPPLTAEQRAKVASLAAETQKESARLKAALEDRQRELTRVYGEYALDEKKATEIEAEILDLQRQMLANYRKMQVELRTLVGKERFMILRKRLDNALQVPPGRPPAKDKPPDRP